MNGFHQFPRRLSAVLLVSLGAGVAQAQLNDTGQDTCYNGSALVPCDADNTGDNATYKRQDGRFGRDAAATAGVLPKTGSGAAGFDFTKIANDGTELPATAALGSGPKDWACTRDNVTGRIWEVKTDNVVPDLRDMDWTYTWYDSTAADPGIPDGGVGQNSDNCFDPARCDTEKFVDDVNTAGLCSYFSGWRLPTTRELLSIVHNGTWNPPNPIIDVNYFPNTVGSWYWSADTYAPDPANAWGVDLNDGIVLAGNKGFVIFGVHVRLVRSGQ